MVHTHEMDNVYLRVGMFEVLREVKKDSQIALGNKYFNQGWEGKSEEISTSL